MNTTKLITTLEEQEKASIQMILSSIAQVCAEKKQPVKAAATVLLLHDFHSSLKGNRLHIDVTAAQAIGAAVEIFQTFLEDTMPERTDRIEQCNLLMQKLLYRR